MKKMMKHFQTQEFDFDIIYFWINVCTTLMAPALPNPRVVPHISADHFAEHVAFIWHFLLLIFLLFFVHIGVSLRGLHL